MSLRIRKLDLFEIDWANDRYSEVNISPATRDDLIGLALVDDTPAGIGRVKRLSLSVAELDGMYVFPQFRDMGIGKQLINYLVHESGVDTVFYMPNEPLQ